MDDLKNLDWDEVLLRLSSYATSEMAKANLLNTAPLSSEAEALGQFSEIAEGLAILKQGLRPHMESLDLYSVWHSRIERGGVLKPLELKDVRHFCLEVVALKTAFKSEKSPWCQKHFSDLMIAEEPLSAIDQVITASGEIRNDASETIYNLINERALQVRQIQTILEKTVKNHNIEHIIQEKFVTTREGRWVLPIKSGMQHHFDGIIHASSQSRQTVFMEPEAVVPANNRVRQIDVEIEQEIERLLSELSHFLKGHSQQFEISKNILLEVDCRLSQAQLAQALNGSPCTFNNEKMVFYDLRHPILVLNKEKVVSNDISLDTEHRILLLSGPNAGGKTVLLKSIGLQAQMSRCGLWVSASSNSTLPFFKTIITAVGDSQSVDKHLSTFAAHMTILDKASKLKGRDVLILVDEICGSTDPEEGSALARSFIEEYANNNVFAVITSHLGALKGKWPDSSGVTHGSLEFDKLRGPTYSLMMGIAGQSLAILTAKNVGVSANILDRAMKHLSPESREYQKGLEEIDEMKSSLHKLEAELKAERKVTEKARQKYELGLKKFETERDNLLHKTAERAQKKVDELVEKAQVKEVFRKHSDLQKLRSDIPNIIKAKSGAPTSEVISSAEEFSKRYPPGSKVYINTFGQDGIIQGKPNSKGEIVVLSRSMRMTVPWTELRPPEAPTNPTRELVNRSGSFHFAQANEDRTVDIRGLSVEEAIEQLELQLDTASLHQEDRIKIVHGHGTDALKRAVRSYLSRSVYVKKWYSGAKDTGSDGVTWIEIKD